AALDADPNYRAARTATERLKVIFQRADVEKAAEVDKLWKALDPKAADFAQQVDQLLLQLSSNEADQLKKKVALLRFLAEHDLTPVSLPGFSRAALEVNALIWRYIEAPDADALLPPVCEYLVGRYPKDQNAQAQCRQLLKVLEQLSKMDPGLRKQSWDQRWQRPTIDFEVALKVAMPDIVALFRLYGQKVKRPYRVPRSRSV